MATDAVIQIFNPLASIFTILSNESGLLIILLCSFFIHQIDIYRLLSLKLVLNNLDNAIANVKPHDFLLYSLLLLFSIVIIFR